MDRAAFEALIARMEMLAVTDPAAYRRRVFGWALLGYSYLILLMGAALLLVLRSMWIKMETPAGEPLTRQMCPELFRMLDELCSRLRTPQLNNVLLT